MINIIVSILSIFIAINAVHAKIIPVVDVENTLAVVSLETASDGNLIYAAISDGTLRKIDPYTGVQNAPSLTFNAGIKDTASSAQSVFVLADKIYRINSEMQKSQLPMNSKGIERIAADNGGNIIAATKENELILFNSDSAFPYISIKLPSKILAIEFNTSSRVIYSGSKNGIVYVYSIDNGKLLKQYSPGISSIRSISYGNGIIFAGGEKGSAVIMTDSGIIKLLSRHTDTVKATSITPNGRFALSGGDDGQALLWDIGDSKAESINLKSRWPVKCTALDPYLRYAVASASAPGEDGNYLVLQYTTAKSFLRNIYFYKDATLTLDKAGHVNGTGLFGKYVNYKKDNTLYNFEDVADIVHKPDKLFYGMPIPGFLNKDSVSAQNKAPIDTTPPLISIDSRGIEEVSEEDILLIKGRITDESGIQWAKAGERPLSLGDDGIFTIETSKEHDRIITISASDIYGNIAERSIKIKSNNPSTSQVSLESRSEKVALLIGINNYQNLPGLRTPEYGVKILAEILNKKYGYTVKTLTGSLASRDAVMAAVNDIKSGAELDKLLIYFAGHGEIDTSTDNTYILPYDAKVNDDTRWILTNHLTSLISGIKAKNILIITDSCYSGETQKPVLKDANIALISSGTKEPVSDLKKDSPFSVFTDALIQTLKKDKIVNAGQIFDNISRYMQADKQKPAYIQISNLPPHMP